MELERAATTDDVFFLYERNTRLYYNCKLSGKTCPSEIDNVDCYCQIDYYPVLPITIGDQCVPCNFKRKVYIKPGEECSICLEPIIQKNNSYLTSCGHSFHKLCAFKAFESKANNRESISCPLCRSNLGYPLFYYRYTCVFKINVASTTFNALDYLEEFWLAKDFTSLQVCYRGNDHALGMKNTCRLCLKYRETGM